MNHSTPIQNPILTGFNPDPSICRVGDTFFIAVSTFEWFPGVRIYSSQNLRDWTLVATPLDRLSQLNMAGNPSSGGIWAPCLSWADGQFWLIYTDVKSWAGSPPEYRDGFKDCHNYLVTSPTIEGPWSEPTYLNSSGFDPSLFHDDDGRKWFVNMIWDYRPGYNSFAGIVLQEFSAAEKKLFGPRKNIFPGTSLGLTEAPHLYKRRGWYYLMTAEGGTSYNHAVTLTRSRNIDGPYELHPQTPLLTSVKDIEGIKKVLAQGEPAPRSLDPFVYPGLQKAGHGSMAPLTENEWVLAHLCARPMTDTYRCPLGRETALQSLIWKDDDWPWPNRPGPSTAVVFQSLSALVGDTSKKNLGNPGFTWREDFDGAPWSKELQTLRVPADFRYDLQSKPGWIGLTGAESPTSTFRQTLLARRVQGFTWQAETRMSFSPEDFQQFAGLVVRYDERTQFLLRLQGPEEIGNLPEKAKFRLGILGFDDGKIVLPLGDQEVDIDVRTLDLGVDMTKGHLQFRYRTKAKGWISLGPAIDASILSDDYASPLGFTGMFVGLGCFDSSGRGAKAYFDWLEYSHE